MQSLFFKVHRFLAKIEREPLVFWGYKYLESLGLVYRNCHSRQLSTVYLPENMSQEGSGLSLKEVLEKLKNIAPLTLAESWDNVGLLVEPSTPKHVKKIFLTNDLTESVLNEALLCQADCILSYHPPIFVPLKSLTSRTWKERVIVKCIENRIAVFSPHTSYDSVQGGVTDWMASAFGSDSEVAPLTLAKAHGIHTHMIEIAFPNSAAGKSTITEFQTRLHEIPQLHCGAGRLCTLKRPITVSKVVELVKLHIKLPHVRLALIPGKDMDALVHTIAICVGSGSSVLRGVKADLYLTGEMLHHDVLDAVHNGSHVILCNHSDSERGFLSTLAVKLGNEFQQAVQVILSREDKDPLVTV
ncbi:NIF3-like protein 1 [Gryllus bimaculatus]|nr:NIF3-like protein 1 [Gryllus bimaculatus]